MVVFLLPTEKIERLSKKPTRAQVVQITTNLKRDNCHYLPIEVVLPEKYLSFETLLIKQYVTNPFKTAECAQWRTWDRDRLCSELLSAVPDIAVVRPESSANFVEQMAQVVIRCELEDPSVEENVDNVIQLIVNCFPDATPEQYQRAVKILISRLPELRINWRIILTRTINGAAVNLTTVTGFRLTWLAQLARARLAKELAKEYGYEVNCTANTRFNVDKPISKKAPVAEKPSASTSIPCSELPKVQNASSSSGSASTKFGPKPTGKSGTKTDILNTICNDIQTKIILTFLCRQHCRQAPDEETTSKLCWIRAP
jgi:hypothetical protein